MFFICLVVDFTTISRCGTERYVFVSTPRNVSFGNSSTPSGLPHYLEGGVRMVVLFVLDCLLGWWTGCRRLTDMLPAQLCTMTSATMFSPHFSISWCSRVYEVYIHTHSVDDGEYLLSLLRTMASVCDWAMLLPFIFVLEGAEHDRTRAVPGLRADKTRSGKRRRVCGDNGGLASRGSQTAQLVVLPASCSHLSGSATLN